MPRLKRRPPEPAPEPEDEPVVGTPAAVPWALGDLLRDGPAPLADRPGSEGFSVTLVLGPGTDTPRAAGIPPELLGALRAEGITPHVVTAAELEEDAPPAAAAAPAADPLAAADVVLAAGWPAAPAVLTAPGLRARAVLATAEPAPLAELGWASGVPVLGPAWLGGGLPAGADAAYVPKPVHRREDLVLVHGEEPFGLLAAAEVAQRRDDLSFAVTGVRPDLALPFPFLGVDPGPEALAHAFASATVALAPAVRGWRPAAIAMLACGQAVVAPDDAASRAALGDAASFARGPLAAADAVEAFLADPDYALRAERARAGFALVPGGWSATAAALAAALRAL
ncbi:hypothetical protein DSM104299_05320 [Baekduia alba]|uniref:hypothetical protein n=1 Tax=Baekduia alba TaxID=2997333 RepID=UPI0023405491|nr:hypothetical protein [Baekduia alba]WCB96559.1 hypothetical protein DSM104299_05320 [Baekduia alba]